jgi:putative OPT family oligopeptide transporter
MTFGICLLGGLLGVAWSTPLRRILVVGSDLPYPEGVACAEVLHLGVKEEQGRAHRHNLLALITGTLLAASLALLQALGLIASKLGGWLHTRIGIFGGGLNLSLALFAIGYLVGPAAGIAMLVGMLITLLIAIPYYTLNTLDTQLGMQAAQALSTHIRYIGVGCIGISAIQALLALLKPLWRGLASLLEKRSQQDEADRDLPLSAIILLILGCLPFIVWLLAGFLVSTSLPLHAWLLTGAVVFILATGLLIATVCGYMAGLIGSSNSPLSGIGILVIVAASALLLPLRLALPDATSTTFVAFALIVTAIVFASATLANDNLQDLKTGQLVGATPWKQQLALIVGVFAGALVIPWVLNLLTNAYGFQGVAGAGANALPAPQANIIATLAKGVLAQHLPWAPLLAGVTIGVIGILIDGLLKRRSHYQLPPLAIGLGLYLPPASIAMIVLGALAAAWLKPRLVDAVHQQRPLLLAAGMIVGESIFGILLAGWIVGSSNEHPLQVTTLNSGALGVGIFVLTLIVLLRQSRAV